jgi:hypothetical protein
MYLIYQLMINKNPFDHTREIDVSHFPPEEVEPCLFTYEHIYLAMLTPDDILRFAQVGTDREMNLLLMLLDERREDAARRYESSTTRASEYLKTMREGPVQFIPERRDVPHQRPRR